MKYDIELLRKIYDKTGGRCHICKKQLSFRNWGDPEGKGGWEIDHSVPKSRGGSDHLNNLYPACVGCNREKSATTTRTSRAWHGRTKAPLSKEKEEEARVFYILAGLFIGGVAGSLIVRGLWWLGAIVGGVIGNNLDPNDA